MSRRSLAALTSSVISSSVSASIASSLPTVSTPPEGWRGCGDGIVTGVELGEALLSFCPFFSLLSTETRLLLSAKVCVCVSLCVAE